MTEPDIHVRRMETALIDIAQALYGGGARSLSKAEIITMAREACVACGLQWTIAQEEAAERRGNAGRDTTQ